MDYWYGLQEFHKIIDYWLKDHPEFKHYEIKQIQLTWITCSCESRHDFFCVGKDRIVHYDGTWTELDNIPAADPQLFEKLHKLLVNACDVAKTNVQNGKLN